jgi:hypothetical protein
MAGPEDKGAPETKPRVRNPWKDDPITFDVDQSASSDPITVAFDKHFDSSRFLKDWPPQDDPDDAVEEIEFPEHAEPRPKK